MERALSSFMDVCSNEVSFHSVVRVCGGVFGVLSTPSRNRMLRRHYCLSWMSVLMRSVFTGHWFVCVGGGGVLWCQATVKQKQNIEKVLSSFIGV